MTAKKGTFVMYTDWYHLTKHLNDATIGKLFRAINEYQDQGEVTTELPPEAIMAFGFIKKQFDIDRKNYERRCEINRENGQQGGAPEGNQNASKQPKATKNNRIQPNSTEFNRIQDDNEYEYEYENDDEGENENENEKHSRSQKLIFSFAKIFEKKFTTEFKPTTADKNAAGPLAGKLAKAASKSSQPIQWLYLYFDNCYKHLNEYHKGRMAGSPIAWINDNFVEIHTKVFPHVPRFVEGGAHTLDAEYNKLYAVETPVTTSETPPDAGLVPSSGAGGVDEVQQPYTFEKATDEERAAIIRALK